MWERKTIFFGLKCHKPCHPHLQLLHGTHLMALVVITALLKDDPGGSIQCDTTSSHPEKFSPAFPLEQVY